MFRGLWRRLHKKKKGKPPPTKAKGTNTRNSNPSAPPPTKHKGTGTRSNKVKVISTHSALSAPPPAKRTETSVTKSAPPPPPSPLGLVWQRGTVKEVLNLVEESRSLREPEIAMDRIWSRDTWLEHSSDSSRLRVALPQLLVLRLQLPKPTEVHGISESFARQTVFEYLLGCLRRLANVRYRVPQGDSNALAFLSFFETTIFHRIAESIKYPNLYCQPDTHKIGGTHPGPTEVVNMLLDLNDGINVIRPWAPSSRYSKDEIRDFIGKLLNSVKRSPDPTLGCQTFRCWARNHVAFALEQLNRYTDIAPIISGSSCEFIENELPVCQLVGRHTLTPEGSTTTLAELTAAPSVSSVYSRRYAAPSYTYDRYWPWDGPDPYKDMKLRWTLDCAHSYRPGPYRLGPQCRLARR